MKLLHQSTPWSQWIPSKHTHLLFKSHTHPHLNCCQCSTGGHQGHRCRTDTHKQPKGTLLILRPSSVLNKHQDTLCIKFHGCSLHSSLNIPFFSPLYVYSWDHTSAFTQQMDLAHMQKVPSFPDKQKIIIIISYHFHSIFGGI